MSTRSCGPPVAATPSVWPPTPRRASVLRQWWTTTRSPHRSSPRRLSLPSRQQVGKTEGAQSSRRQARSAVAAIAAIASMNADIPGRAGMVRAAVKPANTAASTPMLTALRFGSARCATAAPASIRSEVSAPITGCRSAPESRSGRPSNTSSTVLAHPPSVHHPPARRVIRHAAGGMAANSSSTTALESNRMIGAGRTAVVRINSSPSGIAYWVSVAAGSSRSPPHTRER